MRYAAVVVAAALAAASAAAQEKEEPTVESMPPSVVKTVPQAGETEVDCAITEVSVTFSKDMLTEGMWAWCQVSKETALPTVGKIHYLDDRRTCVAPVKLEPGKTYVVWFNLGRFNSFRDTGNRPAVPYLLVFQTRKAK